MTKYTVLIEKGEDEYYIGEVIELPGCRSQGKTIDELMKRIKEAIELYLEEEKPTNTFIGIQQIEAGVPFEA